MSSTLTFPLMVGKVGDRQEVVRKAEDLLVDTFGISGRNQSEQVDDSIRIDNKPRGNQIPVIGRENQGSLAKC